MSHEVTSLTLRCRGDRDDRVAIESARRRLTHIAEHHLGPALDVLLPDLNVVFGTLIAPIEFDIGDYDDETIAWRWAQSIAHAASTATATPISAGAAKPEGQVSVGETLSTAAPLALAPTLEPAERIRAYRDVLLAWLRARTPADRMLAEAEIARWCNDLVSKGTSAERTSPQTDTADRDAASDPAGLSPQQSRQQERAKGVNAGADSIDVNADEIADVLSHASVSQLEALESQLRSHEALDRIARDQLPKVGPHTAVVSSQTQTRVAGICLLYPWLGRLIERAWLIYGERPEVAVATMMALTPDIDGVFLVDDPLLKILAGEDPATKLDTTAIAEQELTALSDDIAEVHNKFVGSLRGSWVVATVVEQFIVRPGRIQRCDGVWTVHADRKPLDSLLETLAYPLGSFALGWTTPISVRWPRE